MTTNDNTSARAGLDLDAITKRARRVYPKRGWDGGEAEREACADLCDARARRSVDAGAWERAADALRALPLPGGES